jgi:hypothetical protein
MTASDPASWRRFLFGEMLERTSLRSSRGSRSSRCAASCPSRTRSPARATKVSDQLSRLRARTRSRPPCPSRPAAQSGSSGPALSRRHPRHRRRRARARRAIPPVRPRPRRTGIRPPRLQRPDPRAGDLDPPWHGIGPADLAQTLRVLNCCVQQSGRHPLPGVRRGSFSCLLGPLGRFWRRIPPKSGAPLPCRCRSRLLGSVSTRESCIWKPAT